MASAPTSGLATYALWWLLLQAVDLLVIAGALRLGGMTQAIRAVPLLLAQRFCYWPLIYWTALSALLAAAKGKATRWNKLNRTGRVTQDALVQAVAARCIRRKYHNERQRQSDQNQAGADDRS